VHNIQDETIVEGMERNIPIIYLALDNQQANHQSNMEKVEGNIVKESIKKLIDHREIHIYIAPNLVEQFHFKRNNYTRSWLVQLAIDKRKDW
jgi:hypothetical protein